MMDKNLIERRDRAKAVPVGEILKTFGFTPKYVKKEGEESWYYSPFRPDENTPSFVVFRNNNEWSDYGKSEHREDGITLVMDYYDLDFYHAVLWIEGLFSIPSINPNVRVQKEARESKIRINQIRELTHPALLNYIISRKISIEVAKQYCVQINYQSNGSNYFGIGFRNDNGGYVIRGAKTRWSDGFKGCTKSGITTIRRLPSGTTTARCILFEGFFDFLSFVMLFGDPTCDVIVLNSVNNTDKLQEYRRRTGTEEIIYYYDNDDKGVESFEKIKKISGCRVRDAALLYKKWAKDLNEYLCK